MAATLLVPAPAAAQATPADLYPGLFAAVQTARIFPDGKTLRMQPRGVRRTPSWRTIAGSIRKVWLRCGRSSSPISSCPASRTTAARTCGIMYAASGYRLAPEYQWPTQIEEAEFVVRWLHDQAAARGIDADRIALGGDSAGGNMTCVVAQKLRDEGGPRLALQVPLYPETALPFETKAGVENRTGLYLETAGVLLFAWNLIPQGVDYSQPYITPLNAKSLADLPPTLLVTNGFDPLRDVGHRYARKLAAAANAITYVHHPELTHGFIQFTERSARCLAATEQLADLIGERLTRVS